MEHLHFGEVTKNVDEDFLFNSPEVEGPLMIPPETYSLTKKPSTSLKPHNSRGDFIRHDNPNPNINWGQEIRINGDKNCDCNSLPCSCFEKQSPKSRFMASYRKTSPADIAFSHSSNGTLSSARYKLKHRYKEHDFSRSLSLNSESDQYSSSLNSDYRPNFSSFNSDTLIPSSCANGEFKTPSSSINSDLETSSPTISNEYPYVISARFCSHSNLAEIENSPIISNSLPTKVTISSHKLNKEVVDTNLIDVMECQTCNSDSKNNEKDLLSPSLEKQNENSQNFLSLKTDKPKKSTKMNLDLDNSNSELNPNDSDVQKYDNKLSSDLEKCPISPKSPVSLNRRARKKSLFDLFCFENLPQSQNEISDIDAQNNNVFNKKPEIACIPDASKIKSSSSDENSTPKIAPRKKEDSCNSLATSRSISETPTICYDCFSDTDISYSDLDFNDQLSDISSDSNSILEITNTENNTKTYSLSFDSIPKNVSTIASQDNTQYQSQKPNFIRGCRFRKTSFRHSSYIQDSYKQTQLKSLNNRITRNIYNSSSKLREDNKSIDDSAGANNDSNHTLCHDIECVSCYSNLKHQSLPSFSIFHNISNSSVPVTNKSTPTKTTDKKNSEDQSVIRKTSLNDSFQFHDVKRKEENCKKPIFRKTSHEEKNYTSPSLLEERILRKTSLSNSFAFKEQTTNTSRSPNFIRGSKFRVTNSYCFEDAYKPLSPRIKSDSLPFTSSSLDSKNRFLSRIDNNVKPHYAIKPCRINSPINNKKITFPHSILSEEPNEADADLNDYTSAGIQENSINSKSDKLNNNGEFEKTNANDNESRYNKDSGILVNSNTQSIESTNTDIGKDTQVQSPCVVSDEKDASSTNKGSFKSYISELSSEFTNDMSNLALQKSNLKLPLKRVYSDFTQPQQTTKEHRPSQPILPSEQTKNHSSYNTSNNGHLKYSTSSSVLGSLLSPDDLIDENKETDFTKSTPFLHSPTRMSRSVMTRLVYLNEIVFAIDKLTNQIELSKMNCRLIS